MAREHYKVTIHFNSNEHNEYFIAAYNFRDLLTLISEVVESKIDLYKCNIEIEQQYE